MGTRKLKLESMDKADMSGKQFVLQFTRPLSGLEAAGIENAIRVALTQ